MFWGVFCNIFLYNIYPVCKIQANFNFCKKIEFLQKVFTTGNVLDREKIRVAFQLQSEHSDEIICQPTLNPILSNW